MNREHATDALRFWELMRIPYNLVLAGVVLALLLPILADRDSMVAVRIALFPAIIVYAVMANVAYCAAYPVDLFVQASDFRPARNAWRTVIWLIGTIFASAFAWMTTTSLIGGATM